MSGRREALAEVASNLRAQGLLYREIAERLGVSRSYAHDLVRDPSGEAARARKARYGGTCVDCGSSTDGTAGSTYVPERCRSCRHEFQRAQRVWTADRIVDAIREWADRNGGIPPTASDWRRARARGDRRACHVSLVTKRWGSWNAAIEAAGYMPHLSGPVGGFRMLTEDQRAEASRMREAGASLAQIAAALDCSVTTAKRWAGREVAA